MSWSIGTLSIIPPTAHFACEKSPSHKLFSGEIVPTIYAEYSSMMHQYTGCIRAQHGWLAWRDGDFEQALQHLKATQDDWRSLSTTALIAIRWLALLPLLALALDEGHYEVAVDYAVQMIDLAQQRLPDALTHALQTAVDTWHEGRD